MLFPWAMSFCQKFYPAPFPPVSCSFPEPHLGPRCCYNNLLEEQPENSWPLGRKYNIQSLYVFRSSSSMFPTTCATTTSLSEPTRVGDRHTMPARSPSVGISSKAIRFPGIMFATFGDSPAGCLGPNPYHPSPKVTNTPQISTPLL